MSKFNKNDHTVYKANLQRCGALISETITVLEEYNELNDWDELKKKVIDENILNKRSSTTLNGILGCLKKRYINPHKMPNSEYLSNFISQDIPEKSKIQVLFPYICRSDPLVEQYVLKLVKPTINSLNKSKISKDTFLEFLEKEKKTHPELDNWSDYLKKRWIRGLISLLRNFNLIEAQPSFKLNKTSLRIETFTFFCLWLLMSGKSGIEVINNNIWNYFFLSKTEIEKLLEESQRNGWISYTQSGDIISIKTEFKTLEEWIYVLK